MSVAQQSGVAPEHSAGPRHAMVSAGGHEEEQLSALVAISAQQVSPPEHGMVGQVAPPSPGLPLLLPLPEPLPLPFPLLLPLPLPPLELLPEEELLVLASPPVPPGLPLLLEHPAHHTAQAATAAVIELDVVRKNMVLLGTTRA